MCATRSAHRASPRFRCACGSCVCESVEHTWVPRRPRDSLPSSLRPEKNPWLATVTRPYSHAPCGSARPPTSCTVPFTLAPAPRTATQQCCLRAATSRPTSRLSCHAIAAHVCIRVGSAGPILGNNYWFLYLFSRSCTITILTDDPMRLYMCTASSCHPEGRHRHTKTRASLGAACAES